MTASEPPPPYVGGQFRRIAIYGVGTAVVVAGAGLLTGLIQPSAALLTATAHWLDF